jgi:hypothetical protein
MNAHSILQSAADFNSRHDYDLDAVMEFAAVAARHAHAVQLARKEVADPQLTLPLDGAKEVLP